MSSNNPETLFNTNDRSDETHFDNHLKTLKILVRCGGMSLQSRQRSFMNKLKDRSLCFMNIFWLNTDVFGGIYWFIDGIVHGKSLVVLTYIAPCVTLSSLANFKVYFFVRYEDEINELIDNFKELDVEFTAKRRSKAEKKILFDESKFLAIVIKMSNILNVVLLATFAVSPLILIAYKYVKTKELDLILPFLVMYPFDSKDIRIWPFVYVHQIWSECVAIINICASDYLFYICCTFIRIQFRLLHHSFENMFSHSNSPDRVQDKLVILIKWHQKVIRLADMLEVVYTKSTLYNFVSSSVLICLTGFNVIAVDDVAFAITFLAFLVTSLLQIFLVCFFADMLMRSSMEVGDAVYKSKWYGPNSAVAKDLLLVLTRAQKPCKLTASGFADVNLRAFTKILSTAWSYFALLKTMYSSPRM